MRERNRDTWRKVKVGFVILLIALSILAYKNRIHIQEYFMSF
jgi:uncharacterized integral membrane protein